MNCALGVVREVDTGIRSESDKTEATDNAFHAYMNKCKMLWLSLQITLQHREHKPLL